MTSTLVSALFSSLMLRKLTMSCLPTSPRLRRNLPASLLAACAFLTCSQPVAAEQSSLRTYYQQVLGFILFNDKNLSKNRNQSCASCHSLSPVGNDNNALGRARSFVDPDNVRDGSTVSDGSLPVKSGSLNAPSLGYAAFSPTFHWDDTEGLYVGGQFWNGRAKNLAEQAKQPFLNPVEMAMPNKWAVVSRLQSDWRYRFLFDYLFGLDIKRSPTYPGAKQPQTSPALVNRIYDALAGAIAAFEKHRLFNKFNAKFDYVAAGKTQFTSLEKSGFALFNDAKKGNCAACHISEATRDERGNLIPALFTDFTYDNIGLPRNVNIPNNPPPNLGLGGRTDIARMDKDGAEIGKHKVMSLRNIAITPPYGHNGVFKTLEQIVHFYNSRDTLGLVTNNRHPGFGKTGWPAPEVARNVNRSELGDLKLSAAEEAAIVAFLKTLTDDYPSWGKDPHVPPGTPSPSAFRINIPKF
jgi:cytochrome c peroxidase